MVTIQKEDKFWSNQTALKSRKDHYGKENAWK